MTSLEPLFDTLSRLSIDTLLRGAILILVGYVDVYKRQIWNNTTSMWSRSLSPMKATIW